MPNQRKKGKDLVGAWIPDQLKKNLQKQADAEKIPLSELIHRILKDGAENHKKR